LDSQITFLFNTFFILFSSILIILMAPGFAMLEAGIVRTKNVVTVLTGNVMLYAVTSMVYLLWGYNYMFGPSGFLLSGVESTNMSFYALFFFQMAFVSKTVSIVSGGVSERIRLIPFMMLAIVVSGLIYPTIGAWTWGGGFLSDMHDLAGSTIIHSVGGWVLLAALLIIGPRHGRYLANGTIRAVPASNIPLVTLGAFLLWIGWFGFNGGSVLAFDSIANADLVAKVIVNTNTAGLAGAISSAALLYIRYKKLDITMILNGALGGLVAITAGADVVGLVEPIFIGAIGGLLVIFAVSFFDKIKIDDPVGALSVHLVNGIWGTIAVAIFSDISFWSQIKGIVVVGLFSFSAAFVLLKIINAISAFRPTKDEEQIGLDVSECALEAYPDFIQSKV